MKSKMTALERGRLKLREYILANKKQVRKDLDEMRKKSSGDDIYSYMNKIYGEELYD